MADETNPTEHGHGAAGGTDGPAGKGKGKHHGPKWLNGPHRTEILVIGSVVLVCLGWISLRKASGPADATGPTSTYASSTAAAQSGIGSAGVVAGSDANAIQGFQYLMANQSDQLRNLQANLDQLLPDGLPGNSQSPLAASLLAPTGSGQYVGFTQGGGVQEVQGDGSLLHLSPSQWSAIQRLNPLAKQNLIQVNGKAKTNYTTGGNAATKYAAPAVTA